jgi:oxygen-independent coproporphyrinogen III oxidase
LNNPTQNYSIYLHIPFCTHRCAYCDFNTYSGQERLLPDYVQALCSEIHRVAAAAPERLPVHTIFFGGGTPSLLSPAQFALILDALQTNFSLSSSSSVPSGSSGSSDSLETSLEANPGTVNLSCLRDLHSLGFNRISFGVQSFHPGELRQLERIHDPFDVLNAVRWARRAGFENLNLDLIYGLPEQPLAHWQASLRQAVALAPEHLSLYALTIERGTPFGRWAERGLLSLPDPDLAADMYEWASEYLEGQGYRQYEISNWARPGFQCRQNLQVWRNLPYLGFGAGAHGCANGLRISDVLGIRPYIARLTAPLHAAQAALPFPLSPATLHQTRLTPFIEMQETLMLGLRLTQAGVSARVFQDRFGQPLMDVFGKEIHELLSLGLLEQLSPGTPQAILRLTRRGRLLGNQVFMRFVGD